MGQIRSGPFGGLSDLPAFVLAPGALRTCQNMFLKPGGYLEARGGIDKLRPSGGTATNPISSGVFSGFQEHVNPNAWCRVFDGSAGVGSQYGPNTVFNPMTEYFPSGTAGANGDATYFGADAPFSRISQVGGKSASIPGPWTTATVAWEYWNGAAWSALTMIETPDFNLNTIQAASWNTPSDWAPNSVGDALNGNVYLYWVRARLSAVTAYVRGPEVMPPFIMSVGVKEIYEASMNPATGGATGRLMRYGRSGTTAEHYAVNTALFSTVPVSTRMASYRGILFLVNGKETKYWDGTRFGNVSLAAPGGGTTATAVGGVGGSLPAGVWRYYVAFGYGRAINRLDSGRPDDTIYGVSDMTFVGTVTTVLNDAITVDITALTIPAEVDRVYVYRTQNLINVSAGERSSFPAFVVTGLGRTGVSTFITSVTELTESFAFPTTEGSFTTGTGSRPPDRCRFVSVYQNRLFLASNDDFPGRVWWSKPFKVFNFDQAFGYIDLTRSTGGRLTGMVEFNDQMIVFTEDQVWGLTNVDLDLPQIYPIHNGIGCIAPDSIAVGDGVIMWLSRDGVYMWDGQSGPVRVSNQVDGLLGKQSYDNHGGSRAFIYRRRYWIRLMNLNCTTPGTFYLYDIQNQAWSTMVFGVSNLFPLGIAHSPPGSADAGYQKPFFGQASLPASNFALYMGETTTQDDSSNYSCIADVHFGIADFKAFKPDRCAFYYQASDGWASPVLSVQNTNGLWTELQAAGLPNLTPNTGSDYSVIQGIFNERITGSSDIVIRFSATTNTGSGTLNGQRLLAGFLTGEVVEPRRN